MSDTTAAAPLITPKALSDELGVDAKLLRAFLRREFPRATDRKNTSWHLNEDMKTAAINHFTPPATDEVPAE